MAIAAAAIIGLRVRPKGRVQGARGDRDTYSVVNDANTRFCSMLRIVARDRSTAATTPDRALEIRVMSEDSIATSVPVPMAEPTSACASAVCRRSVSGLFPRPCPRPAGA